MKKEGTRIKSQKMKVGTKEFTVHKWNEPRKTGGIAHEMTGRMAITDIEKFRKELYGNVPLSEKPHFIGTKSQQRKAMIGHIPVTVPLSSVITPGIRERLAEKERKRKEEFKKIKMAEIEAIIAGQEREKQEWRKIDTLAERFNLPRHEAITEFYRGAADWSEMTDAEFNSRMEKKKEKETK